MARPSRAPEIDSVLLTEVVAHPDDLIAAVAARLELSRTAVQRRASALVAAGLLERAGTTRPRYLPGKFRRGLFRHPLAGLTEDHVWDRDVAPLLSGLPKGLVDLCHYGLTEMANNAIDHSGGSELAVYVLRRPDRIGLVLEDDGVGIFHKIARHLDLPDERLALLELAKGKLTTDPARHTGEGVFFTSRMFDDFAILSGGLAFSHAERLPEDWLLQIGRRDSGRGTFIAMSIAADSPRTLRSVFEQFSSGPDDYAFDRTVVPVQLARLGQENLISRSQAKRLLQRVDRFRRVVMDFAGMDEIGQAFADEIFRVFANAHPQMRLSAANASEDVRRMILRATGGPREGLFETIAGSGMADG